MCHTVHWLVPTVHVLLSFCFLRSKYMYKYVCTAKCHFHFISVSLHLLVKVP